MTFGKYRILKREFANGDVKYILERNVDGTWKSAYAHSDLQVIRDAKAERENEVPVKDTIIE